MVFRSIAINFVREDEHRGSGTQQTPGASFYCLTGNLRLTKIRWRL